MRPTLFAILTSTTLMLAACGGESTRPMPPTLAPALPATASATAAPAETTPPPPPAKPALSDVMPEVIEGIFAASNAHDGPKEASFLSDDYVQIWYGGQESHGKSAFLEAGTKSSQRFADMKWAVTRVWLTGRVAVVECIWTGTFTNLPGDSLYREGGKSNPMGVKRAEVYVFGDDGLVKERRVYNNGMGVRAQARGDKNAPPIEPLPTGAPEMHMAKGTADEDKLGDWAKKIEDAFNTDDVAQVTPTLAEDVEYETWGVPSIKGKKDDVRDLQRFFKAFPDQKWTPTNVWAFEGFVVIEHVFTGTQKLPYGRFTKVTGKPVTGQHFLEIWQPNADGKLVHVWSYSNPLEALKQTGATEDGQPTASNAGDQRRAPSRP